jgi:hypothetical protein
MTVVVHEAGHNQPTNQPTRLHPTSLQAFAELLMKRIQRSDPSDAHPDHAVGADASLQLSVAGQAAPGAGATSYGMAAGGAAGGQLVGDIAAAVAAAVSTAMMSASHGGGVGGAGASSLQVGTGYARLGYRGQGWVTLLGICAELYMCWQKRYIC